MSGATSIPAAKDLRVVLPTEIWHKIQHWIQMAKTDEVSGFGTVVFDRDAKTFYIKDAILLKQENAGASTDIDPTSLAEAMYRLRESEGEIRWWWHSHANMGVFWSGTDRTTIRELAAPGWILATVFNAKNERRSAFATPVESFEKSKSMFGDIEESKTSELFLDELKTDIITYISDETIAAWETEYTANVSRKTYTSKNVSSLPVSSASGNGGQSAFGSSSAHRLDLDHTNGHHQCIIQREQMSSRFFATDGRYEWVQGKWSAGTNSVWLPGYWGVKTDFAMQEETIEIEKELQIIDDYEKRYGKKTAEIPAAKPLTPSQAELEDWRGWEGCH